jgi:hypothetical protein
MHWGGGTLFQRAYVHAAMITSQATQEAHAATMTSQVMQHDVTLSGKFDAAITFMM